MTGHFLYLCRTCRAVVDYDCLCGAGEQSDHFGITSDEWRAFKLGVWPERGTTPSDADAAKPAKDRGSEATELNPIPIPSEADNGK